MSNQTTLTAGLVITLLAAGCGWWVFTATPSQSEVEAAKTAIAPLPTVNLKLFDDPGFKDRVLYGTLPIGTDGTGRDDPFAGT
ncbi:hypothetical protein HY374_01340 [Candidatus Berkelbacteria bacterium]|nr:hypothetical protein [Candidatus Berkelbacteria bacterium]